MKQGLSDTELAAYSRQVALDEIDYDGQVRSSQFVSIVSPGTKLGALLYSAHWIQTLIRVSREW